MLETSLKAGVHCDLRLLTVLDEPIPADIEGDRLVTLA